MYDELCSVIKDFSEKNYYHSEMIKNLCGYRFKQINTIINDYHIHMALSIYYTYDYLLSKWLLYKLSSDNVKVKYLNNEYIFTLRSINEKKHMIINFIFDDHSHIEKIKLFNKKICCLF